MYFRTKKSKTGHILQLVESFRDADGNPRQRIVISLGAPDIAPEDRTAIAKGIEKRLYNRQELFEWRETESVQRRIDQIVRRIDINGKWRPEAQKNTSLANTTDGVLIDEIDHEQSALLGPVLLAREAWETLKMDEILTETGFSQPQRQAVAATVLNRLIDPVSENSLPAWIRTTALPELFGDKLLDMSRDRFYRASDKLLKHRKAIETHLREQQRETLSLKRTLLLYDLTNTYFEGQALKNPKAKRGKSKHKRNDCPQIVIGMIFDEHGFELGHEIFAGNRNDSPTLFDMIETMEKIVGRDGELFDQCKPFVVLDGGLASKKNLELLKSGGFGYFVNESRTGRKQYADYFKTDEGFVPLERCSGESHVVIKMIPDPKAEENSESVDSLVLCKSEGRERKETAIRSSADKRIVKALDKLQKRVEKGKLKDEKKIERAIGALLSKHSRVARYYNIDIIKEVEEKTDGVVCRLRWELKKVDFDEDEKLLGCYVLRTDARGLDAQSIWETYMTLTRAEDGFRALKSDLGLRPNRHHVERRVEGHVFICILAYHLYQHILYRLRRTGDFRCWETIKRLLGTHCYATIVVPTENAGTFRIRKAGRPDQAQKAIYKSLGVEWRNLPTVRE